MSLKDFLESARIQRTIPSLLLIALSVSITKSFKIEVIIFSIILILIYSAGGIQNAINDKDYYLSKKYKTLSKILILFAIFISISNQKIFIATIFWILLAFSYNTFSRKIPLLDTTIMSITHYLIPSLFSLMILDYPITKTIEISIFLYSIFWFITPTKNLKEKNKDQILNYRTLANHSKRGENLTLIIFWLSLIPIVLSKTFFQLSNLFYMFLPNLILLFLITTTLFKQKKEKEALKLTRITMIFFILSLIILKCI